MPGYPCKSESNHPNVLANGWVAPIQVKGGTGTIEQETHCWGLDYPLELVFRDSVHPFMSKIFILKFG